MCATWAGCPPPTAASTVTGRLLRSENLQELTAGDIAQAGRRDRRDHGGGPALDERR